MRAGPRNRRVIFERKTVTTDNYGGEVATWTTYAILWAGIVYGTGGERREAAQESAQLTATFRVLRNVTTGALSVEDRISFAGTWDITSIVPLGLNEGIEITAIRRQE